MISQEWTTSIHSSSIGKGSSTLCSSTSTPLELNARMAAEAKARGVEVLEHNVEEPFPRLYIRPRLEKVLLRYAPALQPLLLWPPQPSAHSIRSPGARDHDPLRSWRYSL